jgi:trans-aconitate methyltransferase
MRWIFKWWATRTTRDDDPVALNIQCTGIDQVESISRDVRLPNVSYQRSDLETIGPGKRAYDILWCHNVFQYMINPYAVLDQLEKSLCQQWHAGVDIATNH